MFWKCWFSFFLPINIIRQIFIIISGLIVLPITFYIDQYLFENIINFVPLSLFFTLRTPITAFIIFYTIIGFIASPAVLFAHDYLKYYNPNYSDANASARLNWDVHQEIVGQQNAGCLSRLVAVFYAVSVCFFYPFYWSSYKKKLAQG